MVQEEHWVSRAREQIAAWVAADGEVTRGMHAKVASGEVALHCGAEVIERVCIFDQCGDIGVFGPAGGCDRRDVAAETARVVTKTVGRRVGGDIRECRRDGPKVD